MFGPPSHSQWRGVQAPAPTTTATATETDDGDADGSASTIVEIDGKTIDLSYATFRCGEALFDPRRRGFQKIVGTNCASLPELVAKSYLKCDVDVRAELLQNVVLTGGTAAVQGLCARLKQELATMLPQGDHRVSQAYITVIAPGEASIGSWVGGSILASLSSCHFALGRGIWRSKQEYDEAGPAISFEVAQ